MRYLAFILFAIAFGCGQQGTVTGDLRQWTPLKVSFEGPETAEDATPNPFQDFRLDVTFTHSESGESFVVPGYFAADGNAAETSAKAGKTWEARFTPPSPGEWSYEASFRTGENVALSDDPTAEKRERSTGPPER